MSFASAMSQPPPPPLPRPRCWGRRSKNKKNIAAADDEVKPFKKPQPVINNQTKRKNRTRKPINVANVSKPIPDPDQTEATRTSTTVHNDHYARAENRALSHHQSQIDDLKLRINKVRAQIVDPDAEKDKELNCEILLALEFQLAELEEQAEAFRQITTRTRMFHQDSHPHELWAQLFRDLYRFEQKLPIFSKRLEIESWIDPFTSDSRFLIIQGETGSGKSTQIPQYLADHPRFRCQRILCVQPRKIAAVSLAQRVTTEYYCGDPHATPGNRVGYRVAGQNRTGKNTRIEFVTEGKILEGIISRDSDLFTNVGAIILDEAHERSVNCDLLLGCFKTSDPRWSEIMIVVTSATIDLDQFCAFFNNAPAVVVPGRTFPVSLLYKPCPNFGFLENTQTIVRTCVAAALEIHTDARRQPGDILCFLPGQADVLSAQELFEGQYHGRFQNQNNQLQLLTPVVLPLYGRLEPELQAKIFQHLDHTFRKIIFTTDIAETSVTIHGVVHVIDSGVKKGILYDAKKKISSLRVQLISKSSAIQRMGRAGRTKPGHCHRLYGPEDFDLMDVGTNPEVLARPLALAVLTLRKMKLDPHTFPWMSPPPLDSIASAEEELCLLGAFEESDGDIWKLTELGHLISTVQQEPALVKMIHYGCQHGFGEAAVTLAAIFATSGTFFWSGSDPDSKARCAENRKSFGFEDGDVVLLYRAFEAWLLQKPKTAGNWCRNHSVNGKAMRIITATVLELKTYFKDTPRWSAMSQKNHPTNENLGRIACAGLFLNACCLLKTRRSQWRIQYYSMLRDVPGNCSRDSALAHQLNPPEWIVYDRILQVPLTLFLVCSSISLDWIREENRAFHDVCVEKAQDLPTSFTRQLSPEIVSGLVGKFYANIRTLEKELLESTVDSDVEGGRLTVFCRRSILPHVEALLENKVRAGLELLRNNLVEQEYLGGCRLLIGTGFQVKDVLFAADFVSVFVRNVPLGMMEQDVREFLAENNFAEGIHSLRLIRGVKVASVVVTFLNKGIAQNFHQSLNSTMLLWNGQRLQSNPNLSKQRGITAEITGKLKFSWATGPSQQKAKIWFKTGQAANSFIENSSAFLPGAAVCAVSSKSTEKNARYIPPVRKIVSYGRTARPAARYRFDTDAIALIPARQSALFEYTVTVENIPMKMDEYEITELLVLKAEGRVQLYRHVDPMATVEDRTALQLPIATLMKTHPSYEFQDKYNLRNGVWITFTRLGLLREAYRSTVSSADWLGAKKPFGQPPRLEIEYFYTATVLRELYTAFEREFEAVMDFARELRIRILNPLPFMQLEKNQHEGQTSKFITIRFQSPTEVNFPRIKERMNEITACRRFESDSISLLFNFTGRELLTKYSQSKYLFLSQQSQSIWIYGNEAKGQAIASDLAGLITKLKSMEVLDHQWNINKRVVRNQRDRDFLLGICKKGRLDFFHLQGSRVIVSGTQANVNVVKKSLDNKKLIWTQHANRHHQNPRDCGVCFCTPEEKYVMTTNCLTGDKACDRVFCLECIQPMFAQLPPPFPVKCPSCDTEVLVSDVLNWGTPAAVKKITEMAVQAYKEKNAETVLSCPRVGCEQLLEAEAVKKGEYGGSFIFCDECATTYCLDCSKKMDKPVEMHEDESCDEVQSGSPMNMAKAHVRAIRDDILNLRCPRCQTVYLDYEGCAALTCGKTECRCAFCALCLEDCGSDAHPHVTNCKWNKTKNFYVNMVDVSRAHKEIRVTKIKQYLTQVPVTEREKVLNILCKDLIDLGISMSDVECTTDIQPPKRH